MGVEWEDFGQSTVMHCWFWPQNWVPWPFVGLLALSTFIGAVSALFAGCKMDEVLSFRAAFGSGSPTSLFPGPGGRAQGWTVLEGVPRLAPLRRCDHHLLLRQVDGNFLAALVSLFDSVIN